MNRLQIVCLRFEEGSSSDEFGNNPNDFPVSSNPSSVTFGSRAISSSVQIRLKKLVTMLKPVSTYSADS